MKNALIFSALCAALASGNAHADNQGTSSSNGLTTNDLVANGYAEARLGFADMGLSDDVIVVAGTFGTALDQVLPGLGAEAELTLNPGSISNLNTLVSCSCISRRAIHAAAHQWG